MPYIDEGNQEKLRERKTFNLPISVWTYLECTRDSL